MADPLRDAKKVVRHEEYTVVVTTNGKIEVKHATRWIEDGEVKHHLRVLARRLGVSILTSKGEERTTRQLGGAIVKAISDRGINE